MSADRAARAGAGLLDGARLLPAVLGARYLGTAPYKLLLALTDSCNQRCRHCGIWRRQPTDELTPDEVTSLLSSLPSLRWLDLSGGEIVMRDDYLALARSVGRSPTSRRLVFLHFATNGLLPDRVVDFTAALSAATPARLVVTVSIDGGRELHDHVRGRSGSFDAAVATARALGALPRVAVYVGTTLTPDTGPHLRETYAALTQALPDLVPARWHINPMTRSAHYFGNETLAPPMDADLLRWLSEAERLRDRLSDPFAVVEMIFLRALRRYIERGAAPVPCQALRAAVFVGPRGEVYACHIRSEPLGNVRDFGCDLRAVLRSAPARHARMRITQEGCDGCWAACEAYPAILAAPGRALVAALRR